MIPYLILLRSSYDGAPRPANKYGTMFLAKQPITLDFAASALWAASLSVRHALLGGADFTHVVVDLCDPSKSQMLLSMRPDATQLFVRSAPTAVTPSYTSWCAPADVFLRLATLSKVLPKLRTLIESPRASTQLEADLKLWSHWLSSHHVNFYEFW